MTRQPIPKEAAAAVLAWIDDMSDPGALALAIAQANEARDKALDMGACRHGADHAMFRRFVESLALGNADMLRKLGAKL
jgi:hypothetical protein